MDTASLAGAFSDIVAAKNASSVQIAVAAKIADTQRAEGDAVLQLLQAAQSGFGDAAANLISATSLDVLA